jgi:hypothetical protein
MPWGNCLGRADNVQFSHNGVEQGARKTEAP